MTLASGVKLGSYEIVSPLGAGGMGEVYRARDTKLGREVAIKVLPEALGEDPERLARFEREARVLASLNHPNIAAIYGIEDSTPVKALVMEIVDGPALQDRIAESPIPLDEALPIARQIAEALEAAHDKGIVHRDLKPANVKITADGVVKVLDFGLAKAFGPAEISAADVTHSPTLSVGTQAGMILGTAAYMSPEQARGKSADRRADIWAFGVVFFEMLTGRRLFEGESVSDTLAAVLRQEIPFDRIRAVPASLRRLLERCLDRDPKSRLRDIGEARVLLSAPVDEAPMAESAGTGTARRRAAWWGLQAAATILGAAAGIALWTRFHAIPSLPVTRLSILLPPGQVLSGGGPAISRDGRIIAYTARDSTGIARLYLRPLDRFEATEIPGSETAMQPFFSPDGGRIGFFAKGKLMTASTSGGPPIAIADASSLPLGGCWGEDDKIVYVPSMSSGIRRIPATGGQIEVLTEPDYGAGGYAHAFPQILPGGKALIFTIWGGTGGDVRGPAMLTLSTRRWIHLLPGLDTCRYATSGHLLVSSPLGIRAVIFDPAHPRPTNDLSFVTGEVFRNTSLGDSWFSVSETGTLVSVPGDPNLGTLAWVSHDGRVSPIFETPDSLENVTLSPDGTRAVVGDSKNELWVIDLRRGARILLTSGDTGSNAYPAWSADGTHIFFGSNRGGDWDIYSVPAAGGTVARVLARPDHQFPLSLSPDGTLLFYERSKTAASALYMLAPNGTVTPFIVSPASANGGRFSPDGRTVAYVSDETGREEVYVRSVRHPEDVVAVSTDGGNAPVWSHDGKVLFYRQGDAFLAVPVASTSPPSFGEPKRLFEIRAAQGRTSTHPGYDVAPDGRFLVQLLDPRAIPTRIDVVENWFEELNAKVPKR